MMSELSAKTWSVVFVRDVPRLLDDDFDAACQ